LLCGLLACAGWAQGQFIGYSSPQSISTTLASNLACTGTVQSFTTGPTPGFRNIGQTNHVAVVSLGASITSLQAAIFGLDNTGIAIQLSDTGFFKTNVPIVLVGYGSYPQIQIQVTCNIGGSFSLTYSGTSASPASALGAQQQTQLIKTLAQTASAGATFQTIFESPFGNSSGVVAFTYAGGGLAGSTLTLTCNAPSGSVPIAGSPFTLNTSATTQLFAIPEAPCPVINVTYTAGGASVDTFVLTYSLNSPGLNAFTADPCETSSVVKSSLAISAAAAATTKIITGSGNTVISVCGYQASQIATAGTVTWITGTGATCGTGTTTQVGPMGVTASQPFTYGSSFTLFRGNPGDAVCMTTTGAGGTVGGVVTFVQR